ncbi:MAG TPA: acyl-ACP--UDP-N-acetylglucosamine O-acyltransferase [Phycisphaerales bacterium]|nr:acyl-ACP--UDP-N-acetylglucosamine O-acyltransferase [Phycisphaerales bacterium]
MTHIHPTAVVHPTAQVADSAVIGPYCVVGEAVSIGARSILHNHVVVQGLTTIGQDNVIYPFAVVGGDPQDRKFTGEKTLCVIGDRNNIREHVTIHRGTANGGGATRIGNDNLLMVGVHVAHDCLIGNDVCLANQVMLAGHVTVEDGANIGGGAGVHHFATVGSFSFVGGLARITKDVPPFVIVEGNPATPRAVNKIALNRRKFAPADVDALCDAFKRLYRDNGAPMADKMIELRTQYVHNRVITQLCDALAASAAGVHGRARETQRQDNKREIPTPIVSPTQQTVPS